MTNNGMLCNMKKTINNTYVYIFSFLLVLTCVSSSAATSNRGVIIPFIKFDTVYCFLFIIILGIVNVLLHKKIKFDIICVLFLLRIILCLIPVFYIDMPSSFFGNFVESCFPFCIYLFYLNSRGNVKKITDMFLVFAIIISAQCVLAYIIIVVRGCASYSAPYYKDYFVIPIGATNNISADLLPILIIGDQVIDSKKKKCFFNLFVCLAIFLTKSRTGLLLVLLYFFIRFFLKSKQHYNLIKRFILIFLSFLLVALLFMSEDSFFIKLLMGYAQGKNITLDRLFSGRFQLIGEFIPFIWRHLFFGNGICYEFVDSKLRRTHNVFIQVLYENGIVGGICLCLFIVLVVLIIRRTSSNKYYYAFGVASVFVVLNSLVEEVFFGYFNQVLCLYYIASMQLYLFEKNQYKTSRISRLL